MSRFDPWMYGLHIGKVDFWSAWPGSKGWRRAVEHCAAADVWLDLADAGIPVTHERALRLELWATEMHRSLALFGKFVGGRVER